MNQTEVELVKAAVKVFPDFPKPGILFQDVMPIFSNRETFEVCIKWLTDVAKQTGATCIVAPESRGFMFGCPVAHALGLKFVPARKSGKLPGKTIDIEYQLEYGTAKLCIQDGAIAAQEKILLVDDLLATGGTLKAIMSLIKNHIRNVYKKGALPNDEATLRYLMEVDG